MVVTLPSHGTGPLQSVSIEKFTFRVLFDLEYYDSLEESLTIQLADKLIKDKIDNLSYDDVRYALEVSYMVSVGSLDVKVKCPECQSTFDYKILFQSLVEEPFKGTYGVSIEQLQRYIKLMTFSDEEFKSPKRLYGFMSAVVKHSSCKKFKCSVNILDHIKLWSQSRIIDTFKSQKLLSWSEFLDLTPLELKKFSDGNSKLTGKRVF